jgi:hypothetical protein
MRLRRNDHVLTSFFSSSPPAMPKALNINRACLPVGRVGRVARVARDLAVKSKETAF